MDDKQEPIAIVGAACRLPGQASSLGSLWDMISNVRTGHGKVPADRWDGDIWNHPDPDRKGGIAVKHGYFLQQDISHFDAPFFSTTAKEAAAMDPMKRLLLEVSYESIENAGIPVESLMNSQTGCYVGCMTNDYEMMSLHDIYDIGHNAASATSEAMTANRVSWFFGLRGPSLTLDTACSSSLYALHLACQSLKLGETNMSLVAGVNLILNPNTMHQLSAMHMLSPEGISHAFDDRANGYGRGEGIGCIVVKRLSDALRDGDTIRAVIRNTGANADGKTPSITSPSAEAQAELIRRTYEAAGLEQTSTQYFECHGTGTPVGDPLELEAIAKTLGASRAAAGLGPLYIGSIKPNVGHTEGCSGLAGVLKAVACLENGMLAPTYDVQTVNPKLKLSEWNLSLPSQTMKWPTRGQRRISVNSFGFGGANAHAILDDAHHYLTERGLIGNHNTKVLDDGDGSESGISLGSSTPPDTPPQKRLFVFSTKDQAGIQRLASAYADALDGAPDKTDPHYLENLAHTLAARRSALDFRSFAVASSVAELRTKLSTAGGLPKLKRALRQDSSLVFVFTGQGAQWPAMGRELLANDVFRASVEESQAYLKALGCEWNAIEELEKTADTGSRVHLPEFSQTLCTVLQVALVQLLRSWKLAPSATVGHSSGEIAAAYAAGLVSHANAVKIAYTRGLSSASVTRKGAMLAAGLSRDEAREYLAKVPADSAVVACVNSPSSVTLSGDVDAINTLEGLISSDGKFARKLKVTTAYHSPHMREVSDAYVARLGTLSPPPQSDVDGANTVMFSSLTGEPVSSAAQLDARYWSANMCNPVEFSAAVSALLARRRTNYGGFVEVGPHAALQGPVQQIVAASANKAAREAVYTSLVSRGKDGIDTALAAAGQLWALGQRVDLAIVNGVPSSQGSLLGAPPKALADLPTYPWSHSKGYWHESYLMRATRYPLGPRTDLLGVPEPLQNPLEPRWRNHLRVSENPWIEDHKITGTILYPAAGMLVMALEGALQTVTDAADKEKVRGFRFRNVGFERGLVVPSGDDSAVETRLSLLPLDGKPPGHFRFVVFSTTTGTSWTKHCSGTVALELAPAAASAVEDASSADPAWAAQSATYKQLHGATSEDVDVDDFYAHLDRIGMEYGDTFRNVVTLSAIPAQHAAHARVVLPDTKQTMPADGFEFPHVMHPATMDSIFHMLLAALDEGRPVQEAAVPYSIDDMFVAAQQPHTPGDIFTGYGKLVSKSGDGHELVGDLVVSDEAWSAPKLTVKGFALRQVTSGDAASGDAAADEATKCAELVWEQDVDFSNATDSEEPLPRWLARLTHKTAVREVLLAVLNDATPAAVSDAVRDAARFAETVSAVATSANAVDTLSLQLPASAPAPRLWDVAAGESLPPPQDAYDLVIAVGSEPSALDKLHADASLRGYIVKVQGAKSLISIAPTASLTTATQSSTPTEVYLLLPSTPSAAAAAAAAAAALTTVLSPTTTVHQTTLTASAVALLAGKHVISLLELHSPLIYAWPAADFDAFKQLISTATHVLWLTAGGVIDEWSGGVEFAPAQGLLRVLRNEYPLVTLPHLDVSPGFDAATDAGARLVADVWLKSLRESGAEMEYAERDGAVYVPRAIGSAAFDAELRRAEGVVEPIPAALSASGPTRLKEVLPGGDFLWVADDEAGSPLAPDEVEVLVEAAALSPLGGEEAEKKDLPALAKEAAGVVARLGEQVTKVAVGQRVAVAQNGGCLRTHVRQKESLVAALPDGVSAEDAAALPGVLVAAQYALLEVARLAKGQTVLVHTAASALGQAAVQVAQLAGADVVALVSSREERDLLIQRYGIPAFHIFDSALQTFVTTLATAPVDVIFSSAPSPAVEPSLDILAEFGFFVDLDSTSRNLALPASKRNASLVRIDMSAVHRAKPATMTALFQRTFDLLSTGLKPIPPTTTTPISAAGSKLADPLSSTVLTFTPSSSVLTLPPPPPQLSLDAHATYILAGGLGALGLRIADMMIAHGAKHLTFLSRSGGRKNEADLAAMRARGVHVEAIACDVNDGSKVKAVFDGVQGTVGGVVQCAMVLQDSIFDNMGWEKWMGAFEPKTRGSWNLLDGLSAATSKTKKQTITNGSSSSTPPPFFILLSSITGVIGNTAQANYAAGNTFEDALARHARRRLGVAATSVDVGLVTDSSHFTAAGEFGELDGYINRYSHGWKGLKTTVEELLVLAAALMRDPAAPAQVVLGLGDALVRRPDAGGFQNDRKFDLRVARGGAGAGGEGEDGGARKAGTAELLAKAATLAEATAAVEEDIKAQIAAAVGVAVDEVDAQRPLFDFGVDSLKAVEIRNRSLKELKSDISVFELLSSTPLAELAAKIATRSGLVTASKEDA
ncbi:polyketide synthase [Diplodia corticola]|uniref:Polyketide synthase n=1 Tax=Diplodia corticola TaxID=236234 RepID=A0A1J9RHQ4_9PEZI|nr:polyketide synthase [Diplodia corticola]OJD32083.1 polyketide synthase [Diplodia corticola]